MVNHNRDNSCLGKMRLGFFYFLGVLMCYSTSPSVHVFKNKEWNIPPTQKFYSPALKIFSCLQCLRIIRGSALLGRKTLVSELLWFILEFLFS